MNDFFLTCPIGFESLLEDELCLKWDELFPEIECIVKDIVPGGILISCPIEHGLFLNYVLKIPSKILLRIKEQKCRDLPKLFKIISKIDWKKYVNQEHFTVSVTSKKSRLIHTKRIENTVLDGIKKYFHANAISEKTKEKFQNIPKEKLFIRINEDLMTVSLDTSGELLHIRSNITFRGHASIRENIAAALLFKLISMPNKPFSILDPMCGTGTLLREANTFFELNNRDFLFNNWKIEIPKEWLELNFKSKWTINKSFGNDIDPEIIEQNQKRNEPIEYLVGDCFKQNTDHVDFIVLNPPYGKRVKISENRFHYFKKLYDYLSKAKAVKGMIIPCPFDDHLKGEKIYFNQNGIKVCFLIF
jgi:putative N6-adenine-specific DNA methylase